MSTIFVTGGAGFIGSALIRYLSKVTDYHIVNIDKLTYASSFESTHEEVKRGRCTLEKIDICDKGSIEELYNKYKPEGIFHLAAESHVDRSISDPESFIKTNINGTHCLLEATQSYWQSIRKTLLSKTHFKFHHVSTDEVYGSLGDTGKFSEHTPYAPNSPYSASKAASDFLVRAWHHTYGLPTIISNCSNNYGPYQFPEKLIPLVIERAISMKPIPVYGNGRNIRDWIFVEDHADALWTIFNKGQIGANYNVGGNCEKANIEVVRMICDSLDKEMGINNNKPRQQLISFITDRQGHDWRYAIDSTKLHRELGWQPKYNFSQGLQKTLDWYLENKTWLNTKNKADITRQSMLSS